MVKYIAPFGTLRRLVLLWSVTMNNDKFPMCPALKVSPQGQVTIPDNIRVKLGIKAGDRIDIVEIKNPDAYKDE